MKLTISFQFHQLKLYRNSRGIPDEGVHSNGAIRIGKALLLKKMKNNEKQIKYVNGRYESNNNLHLIFWYWFLALRNAEYLDSLKSIFLSVVGISLNGWNRKNTNARLESEAELGKRGRGRKEDARLLRIPSIQMFDKKTYVHSCVFLPVYVNIMQLCRKRRPDIFARIGTLETMTRKVHLLPVREL